MSIVQTTDAGTAVRPATKPGIIDLDIHPAPKSPSAFNKYVAREWRDHAETYGLRYRTPLTGSGPYPKASPALARKDAWPPAGGPPGSDLDFMREQHLDLHGIALGMLEPLTPSGKDLRNPRFAAAICSALNDWQVAEWAEPEPRLRASLMLPYDDAAASLREIERNAGNPHFASILMFSRNIEPLGRPRYWPIYEAAQDLGMPIAVHVGGLPGNPMTASGHPSYYIEEHFGTSMSMPVNVASMIFEGVFEAFPKLNVILTEAGMAWAPPLGWKMDRLWRRMADEVPHLTRAPSEYLRQNFYFTTQPMEEPTKPKHLRDILEWIGIDRILFATDYPHWDFDDPRYAFKISLSPEERDAILFGNARRLMGLGDA